ncbi:MAG: transcription initiation factor IIB [Promethearchaeota archaeon]
MISDLNSDSNYCPECGGYLIQSMGDIICRQCGLIIGERLPDISHQGRRAYTTAEKEKRERTGAPISDLLPDMGLTTVIKRQNIENPDLRRAAKWNTRLSWEKRNMLIATTELKRIASNLNLPDHVKNMAIRLYKKAFNKKLLKGRSIQGMVAACLYFACRINYLPRTLDEILGETSSNAKNVRRCYSTLIRELNLKAPNRDLISLIPKYITELNLDQEIERLSIKLAKEYKLKIYTSGKDPKGICAGVIYLACKIKKRSITQKQIASAIGITEVTLRSRFKELTKKLRISL